MVRRVELYEIIAKRMRENETSPELLDDRQDQEPRVAEIVPHRRAREVVLSMDAAFVILMIFLILIGTAYALGISGGEQKERERFNSPLPPVPEVESASLEIGQTIDVEPPLIVKIPTQQYTLRLTTTADLAQAREWRSDLLDHAVIRDGGIEVFIFGDGRKYTLTVGVFSSSEERNLTRVREFFSANAAYREMSLERVGDLGNPIV